MERQQHQHWVRQPQTSLSERSRQQGRASKAVVSLGKPGWALSLLLLGSAWAVVVVVAITAASGLLNPNASNGHQPLGAASVRDTSQTSSQARLPLWLFGAIALSCAAGSMLISKQATRPARPRKSTKPKRLTHHADTPAPPPMPAPPRPTPTPPPPSYPAGMPSFVLQPRQPASSTAATPFTAPATLMQLAHQEAQSTVGQATDASVTVVPSEDKHPLDWGEASLADQLDIRKRRSLSSLL